MDFIDSVRVLTNNPIDRVCRICRVLKPVNSDYLCYECWEKLATEYENRSLNE